VIVPSVIVAQSIFLSIAKRMWRLWLEVKEGMQFTRPGCDYSGDSFRAINSSIAMNIDLTNIIHL